MKKEKLTPKWATVTPAPTFTVNISHENAMNKKITKQDTSAAKRRNATRSSPQWPPTKPTRAIR